MSLAPILTAPPIIQLHLASAVLALCLTLAITLMRKGTSRHLVVGRVWVFVMIVVSVSSFFITSLTPGHFSLIHLLSTLTLGSILVAVVQRRRGNIRGHARAMIFTCLGLVIAGAFTFIPPRILGLALFAG